MKTTRIFGIVASTIFVLVGSTSPAQAQTYSVLYNFGTNPGDPVQAQPANIVQGLDGNLYSTTEAGGAYQSGTVFKITPQGELSVVYSFTSRAGIAPTGGLTLGPSGDLYGAAQSAGGDGFGDVFRVTPAGTLKVLHNFAKSDGAYPYAPPILGADGNFYGTTTQGGANDCNCGTVYKMTPSGTLTTLFSFGGTDGAGPSAALLLGPNFDLYGTTAGGGTYDMGTIFKITSGGNLTSLHSFDGTDGSFPSTAIVLGNDGDLYGTTQANVFKITSAGQFTVVYSFSGLDGFGSQSALVLATDGQFYGTNYFGGTNNDGTIFRVTPGGQFSVVYAFNGTDGCCPLVTPMQHTTGLIYGDTYGGGTQNAGVFYSVNGDLKAFAALLPSFGKAGRNVGVLGQAFTGTTAVSFNGTAATFTIKSDTFIVATVPAGATTGMVTVTTPSGTLYSNEKFIVIQ